MLGAEDPGHRINHLGKGPSHCYKGVDLIKQDPLHGSGAVFIKPAHRSKGGEKRKRRLCLIQKGSGLKQDPQTKAW